MALNPEIQFTWVGHGTWRVRSAGGKELLLDAWVQNNPVAPDSVKRFERLDVMAITHGHFDHIHDAVEIAEQHRPEVVAMVELAHWLDSKGVAGASAYAFNKGGTVEVQGIKFTMVHAEHSCGITDGDRIVYGGEPCGYVIEFENGFKVYFSGDTDVFGDMRLIGELHEPDVAFLPIGGHFTMDPRRTAKAVELLGVKTVVPMHYGTFPLLAGTPDQLREQLAGRADVVACRPGESV